MRSAVYFIRPSRQPDGRWSVVRVLEHGRYHDGRPRSWRGPYASAHKARLAAEDARQDARRERLAQPAGVSLPSYLLVARKDGRSSSRRQRGFPTEAAVAAAVARWTAEGFTTWWLYGPHQRATTPRGRAGWTRPLLRAWLSKRSRAAAIEQQQTRIDPATPVLTEDQS